MRLWLQLFRVPTAQGKQGKWPKKIPVRENTGNLKVLPKHRENTGNLVFPSSFFSQVCKVSFVSVIVTNHVN